MKVEDQEHDEGQEFVEAEPLDQEPALEEDGYEGEYEDDDPDGEGEVEGEDEPSEAPEQEQAVVEDDPTAKLLKAFQEERNEMRSMMQQFQQFQQQQQRPSQQQGPVALPPSAAEQQALRSAERYKAKAEEAVESGELEQEESAVRLYWEATHRADDLREEREMQSQQEQHRAQQAAAYQNQLQNYTTTVQSHVRQRGGSDEIGAELAALLNVVQGPARDQVWRDVMNAPNAAEMEQRLLNAAQQAPGLQSLLRRMGGAPATKQKAGVLRRATNVSPGGGGSAAPGTQPKRQQVSGAPQKKIAYTDEQMEAIKYTLTREEIEAAAREGRNLAKELGL